MTKRAEKKLQLRKMQKQSLRQDDKLSEAKSSIPAAEPAKPAHSKNKFLNMLISFYDEHYKLMLLLPVFIIVLSLCQIGYQMYTHDGELFEKDISLKGGLLITIPSDKTIDTNEMTSFLASKGFEANVRNLQSGGKPLAVSIESDVDMNDKAKVDELISSLGSKVSMVDYSLEGIGSSIGESFFRQALVALLLAFFLMGVVVYANFRVLIPCLNVIICTFSDIVVTIAVVNIMGMKISTAGIAAFLMLIGYSVDTDIVLSTRVLKRGEGTVLERTLSSLKTGWLMNLTTFAVLLVGMIVSSSAVIQQIMTILFIGMIADQIYTWVQNVAFLRMYLDYKAKKDVLKN